MVKKPLVVPTKNPPVAVISMSLIRYPSKTLDPLVHVSPASVDLKIPGTVEPANNTLGCRGSSAIVEMVPVDTGQTGVLQVTPPSVDFLTVVAHVRIKRVVIRRIDERVVDGHGGPNAKGSPVLFVVQCMFYR